jgi:transposase
VHWDATGLVLVWKQLEGGTFCWPPITDGAVRLSALQFAALFSGLDYRRLPSERRIPTPTAAA